MQWDIVGTFAGAMTGPDGFGNYTAAVSLSAAIPVGKVAIAVLQLENIANDSATVADSSGNFWLGAGSNGRPPYTFTPHSQTAITVPIGIGGTVTFTYPTAPTGNVVAYVLTTDVLSTNIGVDSANASGTILGTPTNAVSVNRTTYNNNEQVFVSLIAEGTGIVSLPVAGWTLIDSQDNGTICEWLYQQTVPVPDTTTFSSTLSVPCQWAVVAYSAFPTVAPVVALGSVITLEDTCTQVLVTAVSVGGDPNVFQGTIITGALPVFPEDPNSRPAPIDAGRWHTGTPATSVSGLTHLEGFTVTGLADGLVISPQVVSGGSITLDRAATDVVVGLPYVSQFQTLYLDAESPNGSIQGRRKQIPAAVLRLSDTLGVKVGIDFTRMVEVKEQFVPTSSVPQLFSGDVHVVLPGKTNDLYAQVCVQQNYPLPMSILGIAREVTIGDTGR